MNIILNRIASSINSKLFVPLLLIFLLAIALFFVAVQYRTSDMVQQQLNNRAFELAESFAVATEINTDHSNFVRVINSIGAYDDIDVLFLLDDSTGLIVAASKNRYANKMLDTVTDSVLKELLARAASSGQNQFLQDTDNHNYFVYKLQTIAQNKQSLRAMTLFMEIDTSSSEAYVRRINIYFFSALLGLLSIMALVTFVFIRNIVLAPIYQLVDSIKQTKSQNQPVISNYYSVDELGLLTRDYNELVLDSFNKQQELTEERERSEAALRAKSQFLAMMTHELRTPLNGVIGMSGKLEELVELPQQQKYLEVIQLSAQQLLSIINDTLDFSKIEANKLALDVQPFDLIHVIANVVSVFDLQLEYKPVELNFQIPNQKLPLLDGDSVRVAQVVINLLGNAIKFTEQGCIDVTVAVVLQDQHKLSLTISVKDSGIGLSQQQIESLFTEFTQADSSTTRKYGGTGLGLWISKKLIDKMDGQIEVNSELGQGAEFIVHLTQPVSLTQTLPKRAKAKASSQEGVDEQQPLNILLVEDTEINRMVVMAILDKQNVKFSVAENGVEAVELFQHDKFDLILMDCLMPIMDGFEASRKIRQIESDGKRLRITPIIALTANALDETRQQCIDAGMDEFLTKPVVPEALHQAVNKWRRH